MRPTIIAFSLLSCACGPIMRDLSADVPSGSNNNTAGLTYALAGDDQSLYAVPLNAGVWKLGPDRKWSQLAGSPRYAMSIAVDPATSAHLAVGERDGDAKDRRLNEAGVWESNDGGTTWSYVFNPFGMPGGCASQSVPSLAFTSKGTLLVATACGIARRGPGRLGDRRPLCTTRFCFPRMPPGFTAPITALAVSPNRVWARRADGGLMSSVDDGLSWQAVTAPLPGVRFPQRGEAFSLGGFDDAAFMPSDVPGDPDDRRCGVLIYRPNVGDWTVIGLPDENGANCLTPSNYVGGRTFLKTFHGANGQHRLIYSTGQYVLEVLPNADYSALPTTKLLATSNPSSGGAEPPDDRFKNQDYVHVDLWDFNLDLSADVYWASGDGGVYENSKSKKWSGLNAGLHTQHIQTMDVVSRAGVSHAIYASQDNDAWWGTPPTWSAVGGLGDANWTSADLGNAGYATASRNAVTGSIVNFATGAKAGHGALGPACVAGNQFLQFIQGLASETPGELDAVMLIRRPCMDAQGNAIAFTQNLAELGQQGPPVILRNTAWTVNTDFSSNGPAWTIVADDLPAGANTVFVTNGHGDPKFFVESTDNNVENLYRRREDKTGWDKIYTGLISRSSNLCGAGWYVPVYVHPYDPQQIMVLTDGGVKTSSDGGNSFPDDPVVTALLTDSGTYPFTGAFCGGTGTIVPGLGWPIASRVIGTPTLGRAVFSLKDPKVKLISSPYTGAFYDNGGGVWRSLSYLLPQPPTSVISVGLDDTYAYMALAGRGVIGVERAGDARIAGYFQAQYKFVPQLGGGAGNVGTLLAADGRTRSNATVSVKVTGPDGAVFFETTATTDARGQIIIPRPLPIGFVVHIHFGGDGVYAPADARYLI